MVILTGLIAAGCGPGGRPSTPPDTSLVLLTREGCVNTTTLRANLDDALRSMPGVRYELVDLAVVPEDDVRRGYPTPTLLYAKRDVFGLPEPRPPLPEPT